VGSDNLWQQYCSGRIAINSYRRNIVASAITKIQNGEMVRSLYFHFTFSNVMTSSFLFKCFYDRYGPVLPAGFVTV
jgi:hypothetical protein